MLTPERSRIAISAGVAAGGDCHFLSCCPRLLLTHRFFCPALCAFDFFLTIGDEQKHIWARKKSLVFLLFVVLRYATLGYQLTFNLAFFLPIHSNKVRP